MKVEKTIKYKKRISTFDWIQYFLSAIITISFVIGLIPTYYLQVGPIILGSLVLQLLLSIARLRLLNVILELFIIILAIISFIPILGYIFRIIGIFAGLLEMASFKHYTVYKQIEIRTFNNRSKNKKQKKIRTENKNIKEADFKEK